MKTHDIQHLAFERDAALAEVKRLTRIIRWALGEVGEFPTLPDDWPKRKFYWRAELRSKLAAQKATR